MPRKKESEIPHPPKSDDPCFDKSVNILTEAIGKAQKEGVCPRGFHLAMVYMEMITQRAVAERGVHPEDLSAAEAEVRAKAIADLNKVLEKLTGKPPYHPEVL